MFAKPFKEVLKLEMLTSTANLLPHGNGQGKRTVTLLTEGGYFYPVISHHSYVDRQRAHTAPQGAGRIRGQRPMHKTTFVFGKAPWSAQQAYLTTSKQNFGGSKSLNPSRRPPLCPSMHKSQVKLTRPELDGPDEWNTHYNGTFIEKPIIPANRLHLTSLVNRIDQTEGADMKESIKMNTSATNYFSQYNRIHNKLGHILGPGVPRDYPVRQEYNVITGETGGAAWKEDNRRISGNRYLNQLRREQTSLLG